MRRPFRAEADTPPLLVSRANRLKSILEKFVLGITQISASSLFCQPESVMIDFAKALNARLCQSVSHEHLMANLPGWSGQDGPAKLDGSVKIDGKG
jgi:hypothetical protein